MRLSVIIPILNEQDSIVQLLNQVLAQKVASEVIVVDDGSTDNTAQLLKKMKNNKITLLSHNKNQGKGAAIQTGLKRVTGDFVIIQDADLEYNPEEYERLLKRASEEVAVYGSRIKGKNPHAYTRTYLGNVLITTFCNLLFGTNLSDIYTCYKLMPVKIAKSLKMKSHGFEIEAEITAKLAERKIPIIEVPISYKPRSYEQGKKIKTRDALFGALTLLKVKLRN